MLVMLIGRAAAADCAHEESTKIIPLPVWATDPNEGTTWGLMPVFVHVCPDDERTEWVLAPSVTWNSTIHFTGTVRLYAYPSKHTSLSIIAGASTRIARRLVVVRQSAEGTWTDDTYLRLEHDAFARFYGLGPGSPSSGESSYTAEHAIASERRGLDLGGHFNLGGTIGIDHEDVGAGGVKDLPQATALYPDVPGMRRLAFIFWQGLDLRYDDRDAGDFSDAGMLLDASVAVAEGLQGAPTYVRGDIQGRWLFRELPFLSGAIRIAYSGMSAPDAPFYLQPTLGGPFLLRGFPAGRFYASQMWTAEVEQRFRAFRMHLFGVVTDWQVDPFVTAGQVFDDLHQLNNPQLSVGLGLRAFVHPNIVGRIDLANGGEGLKIYVEIGYPF
jgi:outer membrane protein assembly factor BamA